MRLERKRTMFIHTNQPLITSFYIKKDFFAELAMSQRWSAIFCETGAWGWKTFFTCFYQKVYWRVLFKNVMKTFSAPWPPDFTKNRPKQKFSLLIIPWSFLINSGKKESDPEWPRHDFFWTTLSKWQRQRRNSWGDRLHFH